MANFKGYGLAFSLVVSNGNFSRLQKTQSSLFDLLIVMVNFLAKFIGYMPFYLLVDHGKI